MIIDIFLIFHIYFLSFCSLFPSSIRCTADVSDESERNRPRVMKKSWSRNFVEIQMSEGEICGQVSVTLTEII